MKYKNKNKWLYVLVFVLATAVGISVDIPSAKSVPMTELDQLHAGWGCCCDQDGSWTPCSEQRAVACEKVPTEDFGRDGWDCDDPGAYCKVAPEGIDNAQCEGTIFNDSCAILGTRDFCSWYEEGECTDTSGMEPPPLGTSLCLCMDRTVVEPNEPSNTHIPCEGDACYI
jgi:hypothetical protein